MSENLEQKLLAFFNWLYEKEAPTCTDAAIAEASIRNKFLETFEDFLKKQSSVNQRPKEAKE